MKRTISVISVATCLLFSTLCTPALALPTVSLADTSSGVLNATIDSFESSSLIKADGTFWVWGNKRSGEQNGSLAVPTQVYGITDAAVSFSENLVLKKDKTVWFWDRDPSTLAFHVFPVERLQDLAAVQTGDKESLALDTEGNVYLIPKENYILSATDLNKIVKISGLDHIKAITTYTDESYRQRWLLLKSDGTVLQDTGTTSRFEPLRSLDHVIDIQQNIALKQDGTVWSLPSDTYGIKKSTGDVEASKMNGLSNIVSISAGRISHLAIDSQARLWFWGATYTGFSDGTSLHDHPAPVQLTTIRNVKEAYIIDRSIIAFTSDGKVYRASIDREKMPAAPEFSLLASNIIQIKNGIRHIIMQKDDGTLWGWGVNKDAQLGHGDFEFQYNTPVLMQRPVSVAFNGESVPLTNGVIINNNQAFIPLRSIFEKMGAKISFNTGTDWKKKDVTVNLAEDGKPIVDIRVDYLTGKTYLNGKEVNLPNNPFIVAGTAYLPLRFMSESLGAKVSWSQMDGRITITMKP